ncbi:MAG: VWA domain-containing protein [Deltaproteobacteria bacterium]|nr:VWA domain-containing protein [Deltaproteobacteria bacterium]
MIPPLKQTGTGLAGKVVSFAGFLKARGFRVFHSSVHDALRSLEEISLASRDDFFLSLRTNLAVTDLEWAQFEGLFHEFWDVKDQAREPDRDHDGPERKDAVPEGEFLPHAPVEISETTEKDGDREWLEGVAYSPVSMVEKKDLGRFQREDVQIAALALRKMMEPFRIDISRRSRGGRRSGDMDFPRVIRKSLRTGGIPFELFYRKKKKRLKRLVILADVSGSMDRYARFVMPFLLGLRGIGSRAEVFVFSTSLTPITFMVRHLNLEKALERIAAEVRDWSGGTRIGYSLHQFNQGFGEKALSRRTVVVVLSDGWDLGGKDLLKREMEHLKKKAHAVIWLNPLAGDPDYEPLCRGMQSALPYIDYFLPADSLQSLKRVGRLLSRIMIH